MPTPEERDLRESRASEEANAGAGGEDSSAVEAHILPPARVRARPEDSSGPRRAAPIILEAQPFVSSTPRLYAFVAASIAVGMLVGFLFGSHTGVKEALDAGASADGPALSKALAWKPEIAAGAGDRSEIARLLEDVRSMRAQLESLRHGGETLRAAERLRALEASHEASHVNEKAVTTAAARIDKLEARLNLLEPTKIDRTPIGAVPLKNDGATRQPDGRLDQQAGTQEQKPQHPKPAPGGYVLREATRNVALVEAPDGLLEEVARGDRLPRAGVVTAIERRGRGWVVVTTRGVIDQRGY